MEEGIRDPESEAVKRLEEVEIKLSFLEKELEEYKEASRGFYRKINELEDVVRKLGTQSPPPTTTGFMGPPNPGT